MLHRMFPTSIIRSRLLNSFHSMYFFRFKRRQIESITLNSKERIKHSIKERNILREQNKNKNKKRFLEEIYWLEKSSLYEWNQKHSFWTKTLKGEIGKLFVIGWILSHVPIPPRPILSLWRDSLNLLHSAVKWGVYSPSCKE